jgi:hypothetical protein
MFFFLQPTSTKILPFEPTAEVFLTAFSLSQALADIKTRSCMKCGEYGTTRGGFAVYEKLYLGDPETEISRRRSQDFAEVELCAPCLIEETSKDDF